jgi:hypothetical protein
MVEEYEKQKRKRLIIRRSLMDYALGILIFILGVFFLIRDKLTLDFNVNFPPNVMDKVFGVICLLYGGWRVYRGYKKNYFRQ